MMGKLFLFAAMGALSALGGVCQESATRMRLDLDGTWECRPEGTGVWQKITLPSPFPEGVSGTVTYRRELSVPPCFSNRRAVLSFGMLATRASVSVDGHDAGYIEFPGGELDLTDAIRPGCRQELVLSVSAYPFRPEAMDYNAPDRVTKSKTSVRWRGVTGNLALEARPLGAVLANPSVVADVVRRKVTFAASVENGRSGTYALEVLAECCGRRWTFASEPLATGRDGKLSFTAEWPGAPVWDLDASSNIVRCTMTLHDAEGRLLDEALPFTCGYRDVRIDGKDLLLNGKRIHLRALSNGTAAAIPALATRKRADVICRRAKSAGFNLLVANNYHFRPGALSNLEVMLDACDAAGLLYAFSMPHFSDFGDLGDAETAGRYRKLVDWIVASVGHHPCIVLWATSHNAAGFVGDQNPKRIDGVWEMPEDGPDTCFRNRRQARLAEDIIRSADQSRPVYHHESGNLGAFHTSNCYLNWAPIQERSDWLEHWATSGVKPVFLVEYGLPHIASWSSFRGPEFIWGCPAFQSAWLSEYAAAFLGDAAYAADAAGHAALRQEESLWKEGKPFRFNELVAPIEACTNVNYGVKGLFVRENWRSMRAWGATAVLGWDQEDYYRRVSSPARPEERLYWTGGGEDADFRITALGREMVRWNQDEIGFIGGKDVFTDRRHAYYQGDLIEKKLVVLNDTRQDRSVSWTCNLYAPGGCSAAKSEGKIGVPAGGRKEVPVAFDVPSDLGTCRLSAVFRFSDGVEFADSMSVEVVARRKGAEQDSPLEVYDPDGQTVRELERLGVGFVRIARFDRERAIGRQTVIGRGALTRDLLIDGVVYSATRGGKVLVFEQTQKTLEACGFRVQKYGLRRAYPRYRWQPLDGLDVTSLTDWGGESTLVPRDSGHYPRVETWPPREQWAGFEVDRVWRCGNRGAVATVLPEKPTLGDWCALADGGFDLQYSPLLMWRIGKGSVLFCQFDVTGRSAPDVFADDLTVRLVRGLASSNEPAARVTRVLGLDAEFALRARHARVNRYPRPGGDAFVVSTGARRPPDFFDCIRHGAHALCLGLTAAEVAEWSPVPLPCVETNDCLYARIEKIPPELNGLSNSDWAWHGTMSLGAFTDNAEDGNLAIRVVRHGKGVVVFWQVPPWKIDDRARPYLRTSRRRAEAMLSRLLGNLGIAVRDTGIHYADAPLESDDPYRYFRW